MILVNTGDRPAAKRQTINGQTFVLTIDLLRLRMANHECLEQIYETIERVLRLEDIICQAQLSCNQ